MNASPEQTPRQLINAMFLMHTRIGDFDYLIDTVEDEDSRIEVEKELSQLRVEFSEMKTLFRQHILDR